MSKYKFVAKPVNKDIFMNCNTTLNTSRDLNELSTIEEKRTLSKSFKSIQTNIRGNSSARDISTEKKE